MTREHLWPAALHRRLATVNQQSESVFWLSRLQREIPSEPQIKDVCATCNNVVLSKLDDYICTLFDQYFHRIVGRHSTVELAFDYHLLKRWLVKMAYNSARIHDSADSKALEAMRPYILGRDLRLGRSMQLFLLLTYPEEISPVEFDPESEPEHRILFEPTMNRVGLQFFKVPGVGQKLLRAVHLRSYTFLIAYWPVDFKREDQDQFESAFLSCVTSALRLRPSKKSVSMYCDGEGAWQSFKDARNAKLVFDADA